MTMGLSQYHWRMLSYQYRDPRGKDKTVSRPPYVLTWESQNLGKTVFILRWDPCFHLSAAHLHCFCTVHILVPTSSINTSQPQFCMFLITVASKAELNWHTVETLYSTIYYSKYFIELNFDKSTQYVALWTHKRHPIPRPFGRAMECLLWVLQQKLTVL